jgi:hypothetical protein
MPVGEDAVGKRVQVEWPPEDEAEEGDPLPWYDGQVQSYDEEQGYLVLYDDGEEQWEEMNDDGSNFKFVDDDNGESATVAGTGDESLVDDDEDPQIDYDAPQQELIDQIKAANQRGVEPGVTWQDNEDDAPGEIRPEPLDVDQDLDLDLDLDSDEEGGRRGMGHYDGGGGMDYGSPARSTRSARSALSPARSVRSNQSPSARSPMKSPTVARAANAAATRRRRGKPSEDENEWFYYDRESLEEQRKQLEAECQELAVQRSTEIQLLAKQEEESAEIKRRLHQASTKAALVGLGTKAYHVDHYKDRSKQRTDNKERGSAGSESGHEYVIELKLLCDELRRGMLEVEQDARKSKKEVVELAEELEIATERLKRVPAAERQTLVEARMEVVLLMDEKNAQQNQHSSSSLKAMEKNREQERLKRRLDEKLEQVSNQVEDERDEIRRLQRAVHHEEARCIPLRQHEKKLGERLKMIKGSAKLLQAAFDKYKAPDSGMLASADVLSALEDLSAKGHSVPQAELQEYLDQERQRQQGASVGEIDYEQFCKTFQHLAWK